MTLQWSINTRYAIVLGQGNQCATNITFGFPLDFLAQQQPLESVHKIHCHLACIACSIQIYNMGNLTAMAKPVPERNTESRRLLHPKICGHIWRQGWIPLHRCRHWASQWIMVHLCGKTHTHTSMNKTKNVIANRNIYSHPPKYPRPTLLVQTDSLPRWRHLPPRTQRVGIDSKARRCCIIITRNCIICSAVSASFSPTVISNDQLIPILW